MFRKAARLNVEYSCNGTVTRMLMKINWCQQVIISPQLQTNENVMTMMKCYLMMWTILNDGFVMEVL